MTIFSFEPAEMSSSISRINGFHCESDLKSIKISKIIWSKALMLTVLIDFIFYFPSFFAIFFRNRATFSDFSIRIFFYSFMSIPLPKSVR